MNINMNEFIHPQYPEIGKVLERFYYSSKAKIYIPSLMPEISSSGVLNSSKNKISTSNILNYTSQHNIMGYTLGNYLEIYIPEIYTSYSGMRDINNYVYAGLEVVLTFIGGDIHKPFVLGVNR